MSIRYAQKAVVHNHGPETVSDFLKQRRRIYSGHLCLQRKSGYSVATMKVTKLLRVVPRIVRLNIRYVPYFVVALFLEGYGRFLGMYDFYVKKRNPYVWEIVRSTKVKLDNYRCWVVRV